MTNIQRLLTIMQQLRDPETGCPWDVEQNFKTIAPYTIEEAYEVADAIERENLSDLKEELGDLLLQVVFHSQMASELAEEQGAFQFSDVVDSICDKMTRRHPHVFADATVERAEGQTKNWEAMKAQERLEKQRATKQGSDKSNSILSDISANMPAMLRAKKLTKRAATVGFDWSEAEPILDKLSEEISELKYAMNNSSKHEVEGEFGDVLFVLANLSRHLKLDPEAALRRTNQKFIQRFQYIEDKVTTHGKNIAECSLAELDALWDEAKTKLKE